MSGASGGATRAGRGRRSTTSSDQADGARGRRRRAVATPMTRRSTGGANRSTNGGAARGSRCIPTGRWSTCPGSRPTPSPARTVCAYRPRRSGRRRRPGTSPRATRYDWPWGDEPAHGGPRQPLRERDLRDRPRRLAPRGSRPVRGARDDRRRVGVDGERVRRLPRLPGAPVPRVLAGLLWRRATAPCAEARGRRARRVATPTFRNWDLPIRRQIFAGVRIARGRDVSAPIDTSARGHADPPRLLPRRRTGALARRRRPRRPHAPVQGAAAEALLRRPRRRAVRPHLRPARVLPDPHRAPDPERSRRRHRRRDRRHRARRARLRHGGQDPRAARRAPGGGNAAPLHPARRHRVDGPRLRPRPRARVSGPARARRDRRLRAPPRSGARGGWSAHRRVPRGHDRQLPAGLASALPAPDRPPARTRGPPADGHRPRQGPRRARGGLRRHPGRDRRVQPQRPARRSTASSTPTSTPTPSSTSRCSTCATSGSRCACARAAPTT